MSNGLLQTRIKGKYCVSTIYRKCSAVESYGSWYYETMCFQLGEDGKLGSLIDQSESYGESSAVLAHNFMVSNYCAGLPEIESDVEAEDARITRIMSELGATHD